MTGRVRDGRRFHSFARVWTPPPRSRDGHTKDHRPRRGRAAPRRRPPAHPHQGRRPAPAFRVPPRIIRRHERHDAIHDGRLRRGGAPRHRRGRRGVSLPHAPAPRGRDDRRRRAHPGQAPGEAPVVQQLRRRRSHRHLRGQRMGPTDRRRRLRRPLQRRHHGHEIPGGPRHEGHHPRHIRRRTGQPRVALAVRPRRRVRARVCRLRRRRRSRRRRRRRERARD